MLDLSRENLILLFGAILGIKNFKKKMLQKKSYNYPKKKLSIILAEIFFDSFTIFSSLF